MCRARGRQGPRGVTAPKGNSRAGAGSCSGSSGSFGERSGIKDLLHPALPGLTEPGFALGLLCFGSLAAPTRYFQLALGKVCKRLLLSLVSGLCRFAPAPPQLIPPSGSPGLFCFLWWKALSVPSTLAELFPGALLLVLSPLLSHPSPGHTRLPQVVFRILAQGTVPAQPRIIPELFLAIPPAPAQGYPRVLSEA